MARKANSMALDRRLDPRSADPSTRARTIWRDIRDFRGGKSIGQFRSLLKELDALRRDHPNDWQFCFTWALGVSAFIKCYVMARPAECRRLLNDFSQLRGDYPHNHLLLGLWGNAAIEYLSQRMPQEPAVCEDLAREVLALCSAYPGEYLLRAALEIVEKEVGPKLRGLESNNDAFARRRAKNSTTSRRIAGAPKAPCGFLVQDVTKALDELLARAARAATTRPAVVELFSDRSAERSKVNEEVPQSSVVQKVFGSIPAALQTKTYRKTDLPDEWLRDQGVIRAANRILGTHRRRKGQPLDAEAMEMVRLARRIVRADERGKKSAPG